MKTCCLERVSPETTPGFDGAADFGGREIVLNTGEKKDRDQIETCVIGSLEISFKSPTILFKIPHWKLDTIICFLKTLWVYFKVFLQQRKFQDKYW
jgi:hypothetical protein